MHKGQTAITEICDYLVIDEKAVFLSQGKQLTQEQAASDVQYIPYRAAKDPRCLRVIDPACGSGHFLLYVFDLLIAIYEEAWKKEPEGGWPVRENFEPLQETYSSFDDFQKNIPALIIAHNLYGIDIDPRAIQIAGLAVWLRGQRYWQEAGVKPVERPTITRSNLICAEPLIIEPEQLSAYKSKLPVGQSNLLAELLNIIAEKMALAGEMGILLKLEKDIRRALEQVEQEFKRYQKSEIQDDLFGREHIDQKLNLSFSVQGLNSAFFEGAEKQLMNALTGFVNSGDESMAFKNKLFADDIAHSLAFVDMMKLRFDAIVMNPPFGKPSVDSEAYMESSYPDSPSDVYQAFVDRGHELLIPGGLLGCISSRAGFFLGTYENWRTRVLLQKFSPLLFADFGGGVLDAMVETAGYVLRSNSDLEKVTLFKELVSDLGSIDLSKKGEFSLAKFRACRPGALNKYQILSELNILKENNLVDVSSKGKWFVSNLRKIREVATEDIERVQYPLMQSFRLVEIEDKERLLWEGVNGSQNVSKLSKPSEFSAISGSPFTYWISDRFKSRFSLCDKFRSQDRVSVAGMQTGNDFRFSRLWWEVNPLRISPPEVFMDEFQGPYSVLNYKWFSFSKGGKSSPFINDIQLVCNWHNDGYEIRRYPGSLIRNSNQYYRKGFSWPLRALRYAPSALPTGVIFNVRSISAFVGDNAENYITLGNSEVCDSFFKARLGKAHTPEFIPGVANDLPMPSDIADAGFEKIFRNAYLDGLIPLNCLETSRFYKSSWFGYLANSDIYSSAENYIELHQNIVSRIVDRQDSINQKSLELYDLHKDDLPDSSHVSWKVIDRFPIEADDASKVRKFISQDLLSNAFGRLFDRFSDSSISIDINPFAPLPLPCVEAERTTINLSNSSLKALLHQGVAPISQYFDCSMAGVITDSINQLYPDSEDLLEDVLAAIGVVSLSDYFIQPTEFFDYHFSQYSGFSRVAPVYLPLSSSAGNFTVWLFYQKLSRATLFTVLNDVIEPALKAIDEQVLQVKGSNSADEAKLSSLLDEIRDFRDTIQEILSAGFNCDIDDGVVIAAAPLRKLFKHSGWRDELEEKWVGLEAGDYEWSKLALNYWPERVLKKCLEDRSIAIAHYVEKELWKEVEIPAARGNGTKWVWQAKEITQAALETYTENKIAQG